MMVNTCVSELRVQDIAFQFVSCKVSAIIDHEMLLNFILTGVAH